MDTAEFRVRGKEMIDFIADYLENINKRRVTPDVEPGYLKLMVPLEPPQESEDWDKIMKDVEDKIMPGITHWQHSKFHAYFPAGNSFPSILGDVLSSGLGINGFSWASSPACTELETIVMHWLGTMSGLPKSLLPFEESENLFDQNMNSPIANKNSIGNNAAPEVVQPSINRSSHWGGGVLLGSASECVLVSMLAARSKAIAKYKRTHGFEEDGTILNKLIAYTSKLAHSCVEKAAIVSLVKIRLLDFDNDYSLREDILKKAFDQDIEKGLIPFYVCGTFGTTCVCSFDNIEEIGPLCQKYEVYLHVDAAYAGNALICEEYRDLMQGIQHVDSLSYNPNKWMLINFDSSCLWVKDKYNLTKALSVDPVYLQHRQMEKTIDYRNWGISLSRRFRSLKLWFTIRSYGVKGIQDYIRNHINLAKEFEKLVSSDSRFEIFGKVTLGLVCFRLKGPDILSKNLLYLLNDSGDIHMTPAVINEKYLIRFCVNAKEITLDEIQSAWEIIKKGAEQILHEHKNKFQICSPDPNAREIEGSASLSKLRRKTFTRMTSDPIKFRSLNSLSIKTFDFGFAKANPIRVVDEDEELD